MTDDDVPIKSSGEYKPEDFLLPEAKSEQVKALGQIAAAHAMDGLSRAEAAALTTMVNVTSSNPALPEGDRAALVRWATLLTNYPKIADPKNVEIPPFRSEVPTKNPWMQEGFIVVLARVLSMMEEVAEKMITQNSRLKSAMLNLTVAMAQESYAFALTAGQKEVDLLDKEMIQHYASAATSILQGVAAGAVYGFTSSKYSKASDERRTKLGAETDPEARQEIKDTATQRRQEIHSGEQAASSIISSGGQALQSFVSAGVTQGKKEATLDKAEAQAIKEMIDKLAQILTQTSQSAEQASEGITREVQSLCQKVSEMSSTVSQSFWSR